MITTPVDRTAAAAEGSSIWQFTMCPWADQIDEFVEGGYYADALKLLEVIDDIALPDKVRVNSTLRLYAPSASCPDMMACHKGAKTYAHSCSQCRIPISCIQLQRSS